MAETYPTTEHGGTTPWGLGKSGPGIRPGFSQTSANLPGAGDQWPNYYSNVMRGRQDGPWFTNSYYSVLDYSRTYVEASALNEAPPDIGPTYIGGVTPIGTAGDPLGGMGPTFASPGEGNGLNAAMLPSLPSSLIGTPSKYGGEGDNGSTQSPKAGSESQAACVSGTGMSPIYYAGYSGYSNPTGT